MKTSLNWFVVSATSASGGTGSKMTCGGISCEQPLTPAGRWRLFGGTRLGFACALGLALAPLALPAQSNFVVNGSFELGTAGWQFTGGSYLTNPGPGAGYRAAAGSNCAQVLDPVFQDLPTLPGHDYLIQVQAGYWALPQVSWGDRIAGPFTVGPSPTDMPGWQFYSCTMRATGEVTRLSFQTSSPATNGQPAVGQALDDVRVLHLQEPASIQTQPQSRSAYEGTGASFVMIAGGAPPLRYQWLFNAAPILDATNNAFSVTPVRTNQAGAYSVLVSNNFGSVLSEAATLNVEPPATSPVIVAQPVSQTIPAGYGANLRVVAFGAPPLRYQWLLAGTNLPGATNANLVFDSVQAAQAGIYVARVTNDLGSTLSLPATLTVFSATGGSRIMCTNKTAIYDVDGVTRLAGTAFSTQIYAGSSPDALRPLGSGKYFNSGWGLGFFAGFWVNPARPTRVPLRHRAPSAAQSLVAAGGGDQPDRLGLLHRPAAAPRQHGPLPRAHSGLRWLETRVGATGRRGDRTTRPRDDGTTG